MSVRFIIAAWCNFPVDTSGSATVASANSTDHTYLLYLESGIWFPPVCPLIRTIDRGETNILTLEILLSARVMLIYITTKIEKMSG